MRKALLKYERLKGLYQNKVTFSLAFIERQGHQAHNCKMDYTVTSILVPRALVSFGQRLKQGSQCINALMHV